MSRPLPVPDEQSAPFWEAAADHVLTLAQCGSCGTYALPPDVVCGSCGSTNPGFTFVPVSGDGIVRSFTIARQAFLPGFEDELPLVLVDVELDVQAELRLIGRFLDADGVEPELGEAVEVAWEELTPDVSVPAFRRRP